MRKSGLIFVLLSFCPLAFGQLQSNSITVSASNNANLQPDQAVFSVSVQSGSNAGLEDVLGALQGSGITVANFSGVNTSQQTLTCVAPPSTSIMLQWVFSLPVALTSTKATVAALTTLQQNIAKQNNGLMLSFVLAGTQVSQQLAQSQTCSLTGLIAIATTQAQSLAAAGGLTLGSILAISSSTSNTVSGTNGIEVFGASVATISNATPPPCGITVTFNVTRN